MEDLRDENINLKRDKNLVAEENRR